MELKARLEWIRTICKNYEGSISRIVDGTRKKATDPGPASFDNPVVARERLAWALDSIEVNGFDAMELKRSITESDSRFEKFKKAHEEEYIGFLCKDIKALMAGYDPGNIREDADEIHKALEKRTDIEILFNELMATMNLEDRYFDLYFEIRDLHARQVKGLDDELRGEVDRLSTSGIFFPEDVKEAPEAYWWLHVKETLGPRPGTAGSEYEEKDPEELIMIAKRLLARNPGIKIERLAREMLDLANEAKKKGLKVRIYR